MSIYKRGQVYWYKFTFNGEAIRESTRQKNQHTARQMEAAHRASLAKGEVGIREKKVVPTLAEFISERFEPWAKHPLPPRRGSTTTDRASGQFGVQASRQPSTG